MGTIYKNGTQYGGGGSGTGGHEILDTNDSSMPAEDKLQFKGLDVTDNSTDGITEVESFGLNADDLAELSTEGISTDFVQTQFNYSTEEQVIGKWIDGKPLYQRTFQFTCSSGTSNTVMLDSTMKAPTYRLVSGDFIKWVGTSGDSWYQTISSEETSSKYCYVGTTPTGLQAAYGGRSAGNLIYVTVKYIKTTD